MTRPLQPCGTRAAYERHVRNGEVADDACLRAKAEYERDRPRGRDRQLQPCGTPAAMQRHRRRGELCPPCWAAAAAYQAHLRK